MSGGEICLEKIRIEKNVLWKKMCQQVFSTAYNYLTVSANPLQSKHCTCKIVSNFLAEMHLTKKNLVGRAEMKKFFSRQTFLSNMFRSDTILSNQHVRGLLLKTDCYLPIKQKIA